MSLIDEIRAGDGPATPDPSFPHAPEGWTRARALEVAKQEGLELGEEHWPVLRALQEYFARHEPTAINLRASCTTRWTRNSIATAASATSIGSFPAARWRKAAALPA
jgi:sulfur relay (sulfurtransferase) DsrC/TusE family protein